MTSGRVVLVTGAGRGIGRACALLLGSLGATTIVNDAGMAVDGSSHEAISAAGEAAAEIEAAGGAAHATTHDLRRPEEGRALLREIVAQHGRVDAVIHCAGVTAEVAAHEVDDTVVRNLVEGNVMTTMNVVYPAFDAMRARGSGHITLLSSGAAVFGARHRSTYAATKAAVLGLTRSLAGEARRAGVHINAVLPVALTRMAVSTDIPPPEAVAPMLVSTVLPRFTGNGLLFSAYGDTVCRVGTALTSSLTIDDVRTGPELLSQLDNRPAQFEVRRPKDAMHLRMSGREDR